MDNISLGLDPDSVGTQAFNFYTNVRLVDIWISYWLQNSMKAYILERDKMSFEVQEKTIFVS